ncbi:uncharacterized protein M421DRAFT_427198 [Didymella exigua CBS 183.55]|uniref:Uncharacterized protein n=1 Tax=Didymella exigua CBS 183.55 TaxID=1150837 RepID=A0A6A5R467_9PLEO|nr:uncharacterized protein M421DRAFT_427198 [Didymella exigua CBS 183.55]KAF1922179.1 hypothetical protein M421DRAFT_427198 [Didymella exigua CBS 183.55]
MSKLKRPVLQRFVGDHPEKAVEVLIKCCHDQDIEKDIIEYLLDQQLKSTENTGNNEAYVAPAPKQLSASQRTGLFSSDPRQSTRNYPGTEAHAGSPSPPKTRSNHSKSLSGKDGRENILILAMNEDDDIEKHPATMMKAPIEYSVINKHMFDAGRICDSNIEEIAEEQISVPRRGAPGTFRQITVSSRAKLTWKRSKSNASHETTFFLVDQEFLDIDLLFGSLDSGEDMPEIMPPPPPKGQGPKFKEHAGSFHRSSDARHGSKASARVQPDELVQDFIMTQREQAAAQSRSISAAAPNNRTDSSRTSHPSTADPPSSIYIANPQSGSERIRVSCTLGSSALSFWVDLDAPAQEFFSTLHKEFERKRNTLDRATTSILFTCDKTSDNEGREIQLSEDELEADWEETVAWIRDNKRQKSPHIYAALQYNEG